MAEFMTVATSKATRAEVLAVMRDAGTLWLTVDEVIEELPTLLSRPCVRPYLRDLVNEGVLKMRIRDHAAYCPYEYTIGGIR